MVATIQSLTTDLPAIKTKICFDNLQDKSFAIIPDCLLQELIATLTGTARAIYLYVYASVKKDYNSKQICEPVVISAKALAEVHIYKSMRTIRRRLAELQTKGFIIIKERFDPNNRAQVSSAIYPILPENVLEKLQQHKNRNSKSIVLKNQQNVELNISENVISSAVTNAISPIIENQTKFEINNADNFVCGRLQSTSPNNIPSILSNRQDFIASTDSKLQAYNDYIRLVDKLQCSGLSKLQANRSAFRVIGTTQKQLVNEYLEDEKTSLSKAAAQATPGDKNGHHIINNNIVNNNSKHYVDNLASKTATVEIVNFNNNKKLSFEFIKTEIMKFLQSNLISNLVCRSGKTIHDLILEVDHHVKHRNIEKTTSELHALNAAKAMLKKGIWATPKKYAYLKNREAIEREKQAAQIKQCEAVNAKDFFMGLKISGGI